MIPQIIVAIWLTLAWVVNVNRLGTDGTKDTLTSLLVATFHIGILVVALYYGNFWSVS